MQSTAWFGAVLASGVGCAALASMAIVIGTRRRSAELAVLGAAFTIASLGMAFHGLAGLRSPADVGDVGLRVAVPFGIGVALPLFYPAASASRQVLRHWRKFIAVGMVVGILVASIDLAFPGHRVPVVAAFALAFAAAAGGLGVARRQLYLYRIGRRRASLVAATMVLVYIGVVLAAQWAEPASGWAWFMVATDAAALAITVVALIVASRVGTDVSDVLAPIVSHEPLTTLEVGLAPEVRAFVAALGDRDSVTRTHVIRTTALAMRVALRARLSPAVVRDIALGALLHDIGKLVVPIHILNKPGALTDVEFDVVKQHPAIGDDILRRVPSLVSVAHLVRQHHERPDGLGYPDGLSGDEVSLAVGIVSVCDAWDAMVEDRPYRKGMPADQAAEIITDGAGSQWRADASALLLREVRVHPRADTTRFHRIDRIDDPSATVDCMCAAGTLHPLPART